ncbi:cecropin-B-like [Drosophila kikkawai]|uniref:Cecropin-B-like n=1 Tax=Drosophila kikkawai TaxID=30033 RepID=A0A6P4J9E9_DROKI|nr:cecropin-B-like [Drosophila kikkawai]
MNFNMIFVFVALILAISLGQSEAGLFGKIGETFDLIPESILNIKTQVLSGGQKEVANVAATARV